MLVPRECDWKPELLLFTRSILMWAGSRVELRCQVMVKFVGEKIVSAVGEVISRAAAKENRAERVRVFKVEENIL